TVESLGGGWIAEEALAIAILVALTATDWHETLTRAVTHSGDTDSTGAITGNILGALWGDADLPTDWLNQLEGQPTITRLAEELGTASL
ncbi:MAG: ADP-ribosylglycohydrolase family protein, partial [Acidobacteria bacterium]|nr:ADP-ribosylglycohydrolase family protein [Acidobacteriota bacterium]